MTALGRQVAGPIGRVAAPLRNRLVQQKGRRGIMARGVGRSLAVQERDARCRRLNEHGVGEIWQATSQFLKRKEAVNVVIDARLVS